MNNFVGELEEKITSLRAKQAVFLEKPMYNYEEFPSAGGFVCTGTLRNEDTNAEIRVKSEKCSKKTEAKKHAAKLLFESEQFLLFCSEKSAPAVSVPAVEPSETGASTFTPITTQALSNPKGYLNEIMQKYPNRLRVSYKETELSPHGPYECEIQVEVLSSGLAQIIARSSIQATIKKAKHVAIGNMLRDPLWVTLESAAKGCPLSPAFEPAGARVGASGPGAPAAAEPDLVLQKSLLVQTVSPAVLVCDLSEQQAGGGAAGAVIADLAQQQEPVPIVLSADNLSLAAPSAEEMLAVSPSVGSTSVSASTEAGIGSSSPESTSAALSEASSISQVAAMVTQEVNDGDRGTGDVQCASCSAVLGGVGQFCLYQKSNTEVEFIVKPEIALHLGEHLAEGCAPPQNLPRLHLKDRVAEKTGKLECRVVCSACDASLGHKMPTGPDGIPQCTLGAGKVRVLGVPVKSWRDAGADPRFACVEVRKPSSFWGSSGLDRILARPHNLVSVKFPTVGGDSIADSPDYQYSDLLDPSSKTIPRPEQVEAFHMALQHHTIVVFPTGCGKTLVASLVMHRFHLLNLGKLVVMVEERVTLVDQQSAAIQRDTGMSVHSMSGNNSTKYVLSELISGKYDALVITAGVLNNYLNSGHLRISDFSAIVFDECHHTGSDHLYKKIIDQVAKCPLELRPRVVGLTASPLSSRTVNGAYKELGELRASFLDAEVYRPVLVGAKLQDIHQHAVELSEEQRLQQTALVDHLQPVLKELLLYLKHNNCEKYAELVGKKPLVLKHDGSPVEWQRVTNCAAQSHYEVTEVEALKLAKRCRELVHALQDNYLLGVAFVSLGSAQSADVDEALISPQLRTLCDILEERGEASCTLVFVDTRYLSRRVQKYLHGRFPALRCEQVIGQGGDDGMVCNQQRRVLVDFHSRNCKLIVCTSVLEEGLDVKGCNLVIRLGGTPSLIRLVQSKGRARHEEGELHLIFTEEEQQHFNKLREQETMLDQVLTGAAARSGSVPDRSYLKEFMRKSESEIQLAHYDSDVDSVMSSDSNGGEGGAISTDSDDLSQAIVENRGPRDKHHGLTLLVCCNHALVQKQLELKLRSQAEIDDVSKHEFVPRGARRAVSDPKMFSCDDALAMLSVHSRHANFLRYFSSLWDFTVEVDGRAHPVYILVPPSVKLPSKEDPQGDTSSTPSSPVSGEKAVSAEQADPTVKGEMVEPLTIIIPDHTSISKISDLRMVSTGWFVDRQNFMHDSTLGGAKAPYTCLRVEHGRALLLEATSTTAGGAVERTSVRIPASTLCKHAIVSANHANKSVVLYLTLSSTPSVFHEPNYKTKTDDADLFRIDKAFRVFGPNQSQETAAAATSAGMQVNAQRDLQLLSRCPVIALTFPLPKWKRLMRLFTDPAALGLNVLVTRVMSNTSAPNDFRRLTLPHTVEDSPVRKLCQYTYATLVSDVYCVALNPAVLSLIKKRIEEAGEDETLLHVATNAMLQLHQHLLLTDMWQDAYEFFERAYAALNTDEDVAAGSILSPRESLHEGYVMMKRIVATPSRLLLMPPVPTMTNRLIRMLGSRFQLVYVKFRDEQGQGIYNEAIFFGRYQSMLASGFDVCGKAFRFLQCSNSQQREATAVFFDGTDEDVDAIRRLIIPDPESRFGRDIPKYISRLGLFCTADADTGVVLTNQKEGQIENGDVQNMCVVNDFFTAGSDNAKILTDGAGVCGFEIMKLFQKEFYEKNGYYACNIQIRARGCKGTLLCDPRPNRICSEFDVVFRNSMEKFVTDSTRTMCVVKVAEFNPLTLNREVINLLCAIRDNTPSGAQSWNPHSTFVELQDAVLNELGQMLVDPKCAIEKLSEHIPAATLQTMIESGVNILSEPLLMSMLHLRYFSDTKALRCKTHIPVEHAALAMGAPDPTGLLGDGEIFLCVHRAAHRYSACFNDKGEYHLGGGMKLVRVPETEEEVKAGTIGAGFETFVVVGPVLIYRNPCLDPGDHRVVTAVYKPELLYWKNVALLPAADSLCSRSLSAECSGGDLDGDMFGVIWDHRLVPPQELTFPAVDYDQVIKEAKAKQAEPEVVDWADSARMRERIAEFIARAMCNSCLGKIAVLHLAVCDQLSHRAGRRGKGAGDPLARELAKAQSLAVDFPKTGVPPVVPKDAKALVRRNGRPHFMEKTETMSYLSEQSLGLLYDVVSTVACTVELNLSVKSKGPSGSADFVVPDSQRFEAEAASLYEQYKREVQSLMLRFGLSSEAEMVMGSPRAWSDEFALDHEAAAQSLAACWAALKRNYRGSFYNSLPDELSSTRQQKASAWHRVAYGKEHNQDGECMRSFAWIVSEELASIRASTLADRSIPLLVSLGADLSAHCAVARAVGCTAMRCWQRGRSMLNNAIQMKKIVFNKVRDALLSSDVVTNGLGADKIEIYNFGSTALLLCDPQSDLDVTVNVPTRVKQDAYRILDDIVRPSMSSIADKRELVKNAHIPLLKATVQDGYSGTAVDVSAQNMEGVYKGRLIRRLYCERPETLLVLSSVVQWARCCGLLRGFVLEDRKALLNSGQLQALFVSFMLPRSGDNLAVYCAEQLSDAATSTQDILRQADELTVANEQSLGETLLSFFVFHSQLPPGAFEYRWPIPGAPTHTIGAVEMSEVVACCRRALHCLFLSWDWPYLLEHSAAFEKARTTLQMELSPALSKGIAANREFFATILRWKSKAQVAITRAPRDPSLLVVQGIGRYQQIQVLRHELLRLIYSGRMISYGAVRTMSNAYFMENSSFLYTRGAATKESMLEITPIGVEDYLLREMHAKTEQSTIAVNGTVLAAEEVWKEEFKREFCVKMLDQMAQLGKVVADGQVIFSVHVGKMLLLNASRSFEKSRGSRSCTEIEEAMNNARGNMKIENYRTGEEKEDKKQAAPAQSKTPPPSSNAGPKKGANDGATKLKSHLTTAFVSGVPILPGRAEVDGVAEHSRPLQVYEEKIGEATEKFARVCNALGYSQLDFTSLPPTYRDGAGGSGSAWRIPGTTLTMPTGEWRTAVDLNERQQINFDLGPNGEVRDVVERFVSFVNGTLVDPAAPSNDGKDSLYVYNFAQHDLRLKFGVMNPVGEEKQKALLAQVGLQDKSPVEYFQSQELVAEMKDSSIHGGVTSKILTEYTQALLQAGKDFTCVRPSPSLSKPDMVSFARRVTHRLAFLSPGIMREKGIDKYVHSTTNAAAQVNAGSASTAKVMAVMAVGEHFEGSRLGRVNPFADISLEVDATQLLRAMARTRRSSTSDDTKKSGTGSEGETSGEERDSEEEDEESDLLGVEEVNSHIRDICDELLRVSAQLKRMW